MPHAKKPFSKLVGSIEGIPYVESAKNAVVKTVAEIKALLNVEQRLSQFSITNNYANTYAVTGTGDDKLIPTDGGYVKLGGFSEIFKGGGITLENDDEIVLPVDGVYRLDGWLNFRHSTNNSVSAVVFGITLPGQSTVLSDRPTPESSPNGNRPHAIAGDGGGYFPAGTKVSVWIASDTSGTLTVPNATLLANWVRESLDA